MDDEDWEAWQAWYVQRITDLLADLTRAHNALVDVKPRRQLMGLHRALIKTAKAYGWALKDSADASRTLLDGGPDYQERQRHHLKHGAQWDALAREGSKHVVRHMEKLSASAPDTYALIIGDDQLLAGADGGPETDFPPVWPYERHLGTNLLQVVRRLEIVAVMEQVENHTPLEPARSGAAEDPGRKEDLVVTAGVTPVLEVVADPPDVVVSTVSVAASAQAVRKTHSAIAASRISRR